MTGERGVLFVCLGNICRSPIAESVFRQLVNERQLTAKWFADSAATGSWHMLVYTGSTPDNRAVNVLKRFNIETNHRARQLCDEDFNKYEYIFGMDHQNIEDIRDMAPRNSSAKIELLGKYDPEKQLIIKDPYYESGDKGFVTNYEQCLRCCNAFLDQFK